MPNPKSNRKPTTPKPRKPANRANIRLSTIPTEIRGFVETYGGGDQTPILVWDITPTGLGIWTPNELSANTAVTVTINTPGIAPLTATIVWCQVSGETLGGFRAGLTVTGKSNALRSLYERMSR